MADIPESKIGTYLNLKIMVDGSELDDSWQIEEVDIEKSVNKIPVATVMIHDGSAARADFEISNEDVFVPGSEIEIQAGYDSDIDTVFKGIICKHELKLRASRSYLSIECRDKAVKMTIGRKNSFYTDQADSDIISSLIGKAGLESDVDSTTPTHDELVQYYATNWDFMLMRADVNGMIAIVSDGKVSIKKPDLSGQAALKLTYGTDILDFYAEMDGLSQLASVKSYSWDMETLEVTDGSPEDISDNGQGNISSDDLKNVNGLKEFRLQSAGQVDKDTLNAWATAKLQRSRLAKTKTRFRYVGNSMVLPGNMIEINGMGNRFNGNAYVSSVRHTIKQGGWETEVKTGLDLDWFREEIVDVEASPASGLVPAAGGLHYGIVKKINEDPAGATRVQVSLPLMENTDGIWARLANMYATGDAGTFFMPEINDEVVVGFLSDDPDYPVILGSLYSKKNKPPYKPDEDNTTKAIVTKNQLVIEFNDEDKIITIKTPNGNTICFNDDEGSISINDENSNSATFSSSGVTIESDSDMTLKAGGKINLQADSNISIKSNMNVSVEGMEVSHKAQTNFSASGQAMAELKASGNLTIKGAMVMIN